MSALVEKDSVMMRILGVILVTHRMLLMSPADSYLRRHLMMVYSKV